MPFIIDRGRSRRTLLALLCALPACAALPASAAASSSPLANAPACASQAMQTPFTRWGDSGDYTLAAGGSFEGGIPWLTTGATSIVADNEPYDVTGVAADDHALSLSPGSSALSPPMCVTLAYPWMRFFARHMSTSGTLRVDVLYLGLFGNVQSLTLASLSSSSSSWFVTGQIPLLVNTLAILSMNGSTPVAFRFTPVGAASDWRIDDVYVDPYRRS